MSPSPAPRPVTATATADTTAAARPEAAATPMMVQYLGIKQSHPDCLLFYRMGDFYELFFDDAVKAAAALDITLTKRGRHLDQDIPMCGVPIHAADAYLARLIRKGFRVAVCEQTENPAEAKKRGAKSVVAREIKRVVTAGTLSEDTLLDARRSNYLAVLGRAGRDLALAWCDMAAGKPVCQPIEDGELATVLDRIAPGEIIVPEKLARPEGALHAALRDWQERLTPLPDSRFDSLNGEARLKTLFAVRTLDGFGPFGRAELSALGALVDYLELTQAGQLPRLEAPSRFAAEAVMQIDRATRRNLELTVNLSGGREGSLLAVIDRTVTGGGARLLAERLAAPLCDPARIEGRLQEVACFIEAGPMRETIRRLFATMPDLERILARLTLGRGTPRDLAGIRDGLTLTGECRAAMGTLESPPPGIARALSGLGTHDVLIDRLCRALAPDLPATCREGGFIARGYAPPLDKLTDLRREGARHIANLEAQYRREVGIETLKIRHNNLLGYFIEVASRHAERMGEPFIHRQSMTNVTRYTSVALNDLARDIAEAGEKAMAMELALFTDLVAETVTRAREIADAAAAVARLDVAASLAELAATQRHCRPVVDDSMEFAITGGRHPVVEAALAEERDGRPFTANDCNLARDRRLWLVTGPNMAGKSTFLRQNALIAVMAQIGAYVPAERARIGVIDRLFSRVGAADDLARGRSTFMVEMVETATILNQAGERALVILDEIGRGTATFDGLSIAWAAIEYLHEVNRARALFATHYHELTTLSGRLDALTPHCMRVKEWQGEVIFLHEVIRGAADRSYGIHVARLAGLPEQVVARARDILRELEAGEQSGTLGRLSDDLPLFSVAASAAADDTHAPPPDDPQGAALRQALHALNPDELSPKDALDMLYRLKSLSGAGD